MTIKAIKEKYKNFMVSGNERNSFVVYDFGGEVGKVVIIVNIKKGSFGRWVTGVIRVSDGKSLLDGSCRPCDNLDDAIDVAGEMI